MRFHQMPRPLLHLIATILFTPRLTIAFALPSPAPTAGVSLNQLFARDCTPCGWNNQICCDAGSGCFTDANDEATCTPNGASVTQAGTGYWQYYTSIYVETGLVTMTSVYSSYVSGGGAVATAAALNCGAGEQNCNTICCATNQYCIDFEAGQCAAAAGGSSSFYSTAESTGAAGAPIRPTTSGTVVVTATVSPTETVPYIAPVPTGANVTVTSDESSGGGGGLSGGAIAGIVIGVLAALLLLALLCFCCCVRGIWAACFGGKRKRRTEVEEYERRSHRTSGGKGRTWFGVARPPARVDQHERHNGGKLLGVGAGLAALWALLGLKRRHDRRHEEKYSEYSYSTDYTSASSASSDDRRTRDTRRSMSRR